ncbi:hypothetical protein, partial [Klebsiella pneumoniae]|uniref:hypothetical protein n=1 Tax=Klebsiella pneumoniae TaxID=573 RepID=UPI001C55B9F7
GWLLTGVFVCLVGFSTSSLALMGVMVFIAGSIMNGAQSSMPAPALPLFSYPFTKIFEATSSR